MSHFVLKLYVAGQTPRSEKAIANLRWICEQQTGESCELIIIDVLENPQLAEQDKILATPTLVRETPPPRRCIIGDLSDPYKVLNLLGLHLRNSNEGQE